MLARYPGLPGALALRCEAGLRQSRALARSDCEAALAAFSQGTSARLTLAMLLRRAGDERGAIDHLERVVALDPEQHEAWTELERAYAATGQGQRATDVRRRRAEAGRGTMKPVG